MASFFSPGFTLSAKTINSGFCGELTMISPRACSRAPLPMRRNFIGKLILSVMPFGQVNKKANKKVNKGDKVFKVDKGSLSYT